MKRLETCLTLISVALLAASCVTAGASDGAGYAALHPNAQTRTFIFKHDRPFVDEVAAHNVQCGKDPMCRK